MSNSKYYICPFCGRRYTKSQKKLSKTALYSHMEIEHPEELHGLPAAQIYFNWNNNYPLEKGFGKSILSGKPTPFNLTTERYERLADDHEKELYRKMFIDRMKKTYGKETLLDDPEVQKRMLMGRKISGTYKWSDGIHETNYTGSYERDFLKYLDLVLDWNPEDILAPAPQIFPYEYDGKTHFHIPDFFIDSLSLVVNIKSSSNQHYRLRDLDIEIAEDNAIKKSNYNYIKILDKDYSEFSKFYEKTQN